MSQARTITTTERFGVYLAWDGRCFWCRELVKFSECHIDHVLPISARDSLETLRNAHALPPSFEIDSFENWAPSCQGCNIKKRALVLSSTPAMAVNLQLIRERAPKAQFHAEEYDRDRQIAPLLAKLQRAFALGDIARHEIDLIISKAPLPEGQVVRLSEEWQVKQENGEVVVVQLSPLYTKEGRRQFRAEQAAIRQQIEQLESRFAELNSAMAKLDPTTTEGQEQLNVLSLQKADVERGLVALKSSVRNIGFTAHMD